MPPKLFHTPRKARAGLLLTRHCREGGLLKNFGFRKRDGYSHHRINGKMNELQAAVGLVNLRLVDEERARRMAIKRPMPRRLQVSRASRLYYSTACERRLQYMLIRVGADSELRATTWPRPSILYVFRALFLSALLRLFLLQPSGFTHIKVANRWRRKCCAAALWHAYGCRRRSHCRDVRHMRRPKRLPVPVSRVKLRYSRKAHEKELIYRVEDYAHIVFEYFTHDSNMKWRPSR